MAAGSNGKLDITHPAGFWLRDAQGEPTRAFEHICWNGCMFPGAELMKSETRNWVRTAMVRVRDAHG